MKSNKDLTINEFLAAQNIKRALNALCNHDDVTEVKNHLYSALANIYN